MCLGSKAAAFSSKRSLIWNLLGQHKVALFFLFFLAGLIKTSNIFLGGAG